MNDFSNDNSSRPTGIYTNNNISTSNISNNYIYDNISISPIISRNASPNTSDIVIKNIHNKVIVIIIFLFIDFTKKFLFKINRLEIFLTR